MSSLRENVLAGPRWSLARGPGHELDAAEGRRRGGRFGPSNLAIGAECQAQRPTLEDVPRRPRRSTGSPRRLPANGRGPTPASFGWARRPGVEAAQQGVRGGAGPTSPPRGRRPRGDLLDFQQAPARADHRPTNRPLGKIQLEWGLFEGGKRVGEMRAA